MKDIATKVGVSTALVSYVMNGLEKEKRVSEKLTKQIREVAKELNYQPNQIARSLRRGSTMTIGLMLADIANPFFASIARVIEDEAAKQGYVVIFGSSDESAAKSETLMHTFYDRQVDGLIIMPAEGTDNQIKQLTKRKIPFVLVDRYFPNLAANHVVLDNYNASVMAVNHFVEKGFKRIGIIAYKSTMVHMRNRISGFTDAMSTHNLQETCFVTEIDYNYIQEEVENAILNFVVNENKVDALLFATNSLTTSGLYCIKKYDIKVPNQLAIIGFDGSESFDFFYSPVTCLKQPIVDMGKETVKVLLDLLNDSAELNQIAFQPSLVIRDSCG